jgi:hypothetical protein
MILRQVATPADAAGGRAACAHSSVECVVAGEVVADDAANRKVLLAHVHRREARMVGRVGREQRQVRAARAAPENDVI